MMNCQEYIFKLSSQQFDEAPLGVKAAARVHRMVCKRCRAFTRNDEKLDDLLVQYREQILSSGDQE